MLEQLNAKQLASLASEYSQIAQTINTFLNANDVEPDSVFQKLSTLTTNCANISTTLAVDAARAIFSDSDAAFKDLQAVTNDANDAAGALQNEAAKLTRAINVLTGMVGLAGALATGNALSVASAIGNLHGAIWG